MRTVRNEWRRIVIGTAIIVGCLVFGLLGCATQQASRDAFPFRSIGDVSGHTVNFTVPEVNMGCYALKLVSGKTQFIIALHESRWAAIRVMPDPWVWHGLVGDDGAITVTRSEPFDRRLHQGEPCGGAYEKDAFEPRGRK